MAEKNLKLTLSLVVPVYNEEESIDFFMSAISKAFAGVSNLDIEIVFVNDGSEDKTLETLLEHQRRGCPIKIVDLTRNFGKEAALSAGLQEARGQVVVPIDVDLQDPPEIILQMLEKWSNGYEVVLGRRSNRDSDTWLKRATAHAFYRIHNKIAALRIPENVGDFRLMDRRVVDAINELPESRRFMKGLFAWVGFKTTYVDYVRPNRVAGKTKFNGWKLWNFALEGVTSFSTAPLRVWTYIGLLFAILAFAFAIFIALRIFIFGVDIPGYASIIVAISFFGGMQLVGIGLIGEYLGRTYIESKRRPIYLVREIFDTKD